MDTPPFISSYSSYHALIIPIVIGFSLMIDGSFRSSFIANGSIPSLFGIAVLLGALFVTSSAGLNRGKVSAGTKAIAVSSLTLIQFILGLALGWESIRSGEILGQFTGGLMTAFAIYRLIVFRLGSIPEASFENIAYRSSDRIILIGAGVIIGISIVLSPLTDLFGLSAAYLVADGLTHAKRRS
jgi:hypothetical protein